MECKLLNNGFLYPDKDGTFIDKRCHFKPTDKDRLTIDSIIFITV